jgi:adenine phosphoribosyltransferase
MSDLKRLIHDVPDFPKPGILFRDITPLLRDPAGFALATKTMADMFSEDFDLVVGVEARGFILGAAMALHLKKGFVPIRKAGKLPSGTIKAAYELEYGTAEIEIQRDAITAGQRILLVDDVLATGGTMACSCQLIEEIGAQVVGIGFLIELLALKGRQQLQGYHIEASIQY